MSSAQPEPLTGAGVKLAATTTAASLRGSHSLPLHQVLHLAIQGDPPGQDLVLFPAGQAPCCPEITADGGLKVGQLTVWVHAVNYVCGGEPVVEGAQHVSSRGVWVHVARRGRGNLWIRGLQGSPWPPTFSFYGWSWNRHDGGGGVRLVGAAEAAGWAEGKDTVKQPMSASAC